MSDLVSRTRFEADDSAYMDTIERMRSRTREIFAEMSRESVSLGEGTPDYIAQRASESQRASERRYQEEQHRIRERRDEISRDVTMTGSQRESALESVRRDEQVANQNLSESRLQTELLREMIDTIRTTARQELLDDRSDVQQRVDMFRRGDVPDDEFERAVVEEQSRMLGEPEAKPPKQWVEVMKGVLAASLIQQLAKLPNVLATSRDEEEAISGLWSAVPFVGDALANASSRSMELQERRDQEVNELTKLGLYGKMARDREDWRGIGEYTESDSLEEMYNRRLYGSPSERAAAGGEINDMLSAMGSPNGIMMGNGMTMNMAISKASNFGVSGVDFYSQLGDINRAYGYAQDRSEAAQLGVDYSAIQKNQDVDAGTLQSMARLMRGTDNSLAGLSYLVDQANTYKLDYGGSLSPYKYEDETNPRMRQREMFQNIASLGQSRFGRGIAFDATETVSLVNNMMRSGGTLSDMGAISAIDSKMSSGGTDFENAFMYQVYADEMAAAGQPATYMGFLKWREKGATSSKIQGVTNQITSRFGKSDIGTLMTKQLLGARSFQEAETLMNKDFWIEPTKGSESTIEKYRASMESNALVTARQKSQAEITDAFTESMWSGMAEVFVKIGDALYERISNSDLPYADEFSDFMKKMFSEPER